MPKHIDLQTIALDIHANSDKQLFRAFARCLSPSVHYDYSTLLDRLNHLKSNDTAAIGNGILVFHGWIEDWDKRTVSYIRLKTPFDHKHTPDREPIHTALLLLSPKDDGPIHLRRLSNLTRFMKDRDNQAMLAGANNADAVQAIFTGLSEEKRAA